MQVREVMTKDVKLVSPEDTLSKVAQMMKKEDIGSLPVGADDRLQGMITDRDIAIRAVAEGKNPEESMVKDCMSEGIFYCFEDDDLSEVSDKMVQTKVRRLPVLNREKRLVGFVSLSDMATSEQNQGFVFDTLKEITH